MGAHPTARGPLTAILLVAGAVRAAQALLRWDEIALAYAAYTEPTARALARGEPGLALAGWVGLHPPLYALLHALGELLLPVPLLWLLLSAVFSLLAVAMVARTGGWPAAAVLASAPLQVAYAGEVNNYPLAVLALALVLVAAGARWGWLALAAVVAAWSHVLAGIGALAVVGWRLLRPRQAGEGPRLLLATLLGMMPVAAGALRLVGQDSTWAQPTGAAREWVAQAVGAVGPEALLLAPLALVGLRREALAAWLPVVLALSVALLLGAAAPHQMPYLLLLGPPAAVAVGRAVAGRRLLLVAVGLLCALRAGRVAVDEAGRASAIVRDQQRERAVDRAVAGSVPGDALWLVAPALQPDDDKSATSPVLWRFRPWSWMPAARPVDFEYRDWRYGQPRTWHGRTLHSSTELDLAPFDHVAGEVLGRGHRVWVVLYEHGPATGLVARVERALRPYAFTAVPFPDSDGLGGDRLYVVTERVP